MRARPLRALLVDDRESDVALAVHALAGTEWARFLDVASDGDRALEVLHGPAATPDRFGLVLLDLKMPRLDGLEILRIIRADPRTCWLPVVILTSSLQPRDVTDSYAVGANSYLLKSLDFVRFRDALRATCTYWLELNRLPPPELPVQSRSGLSLNQAP